MGSGSTFSSWGTLALGSRRRISRAMTQRGTGGKQLKQSIEVQPLSLYKAWALKQDPRHIEATEIVKWNPPIMDKWPNHPFMIPRAVSKGLKFRRRKEVSGRPGSAMGSASQPVNDVL